MKQQLFLLILGMITILGFILRLDGYDRTPGWNESLDEIHYAWTGQTWITTGVPKSWSFLSSYPTATTVRLWNTDFRLVSPVLEKPPLYPLLSGATVLLFGQDELHEVRISTIRLLPLVLSIFSIFLTGLVGRKVFSPTVGLVAALLFATTPPIILANRLSVTENLLIPLFLASQLLLLKNTCISAMLQHVIYTSIFSVFAILTKQIGLIAPAVSLLSLALQKQWKFFFILCIFSAGALMIYPITGSYYDWQLFRNIQSEQRRIGLQGGLPQLMQTIIARPLITTEKLFPDGVLLLGYMLLFTCPWWLSSSVPPLRLRGGQGELRNIVHNPSIPLHDMGGRIAFNHIFLSLPFFYISYLALAITGAEAIGSGQAFWGWYVFPLFPYLTILVAVVLEKLRHSATILTSLITTIILGSSMIRYVFLSLPREFHYRWQPALFILLLIAISTKYLPETYRKRLLLFLFTVFIGVNLYASMNLSLIYSDNPQP